MADLFLRSQPLDEPTVPTNTTKAAYGGPGAEPAPGNGSQGSPRPRSCITCRKRKVKCDKRRPCSNCHRAQITCVFPSSERASRQLKKKSADVEIVLARVRKLEGVVQELRKNGGDAVDIDEVVRGVDGLEGTSEALACEETPPADNSTNHVEEEFGRLVLEEGKSRYGSSALWTSLSEQVEDIKEILDHSSDDDDYPSPSDSGGVSSATSGHHGFLFGFNSLVVDMHRLHPDPQQIPYYWQAFAENVDPMIKLGHAPTMKVMIMNASNDLSGVARGFECLMFAMYHAAVTSLAPQECSDRLGASKSELLEKYRFGVEQALARAGLLNTQEIVVLQAFVTFLITVRRYDESRFVWTLTGLAIRLARALGLHRDGTVFKLSNYETEMRRRLWWSLIVLDLRAAEDHGTEPTIMELTFDTRMPLNIDDAEISLNTTQAPESRVGCTEMTFCLLRYEVSSTIRRLDYVPPGTGRCHDIASSISLQQKEHMIELTNKRLEQRYLQHCDMRIPIQWVTATVGRLVMARLWLMVYHPLQRPGSPIELSQSVKDRLFVTSIEVIEYARLLETEQSTAKWGWMFRTNVQWYALSYLLAELCISTTGDVVDRAWRAVNGVFDCWGESFGKASSAGGDGGIVGGRKGMLWGPLKQLVAKAKKAREAEHSRQRTMAEFAATTAQHATDEQHGTIASTAETLAMADLAMSMDDLNSPQDLLAGFDPATSVLPTTELPPGFSPSMTPASAEEIPQGEQVLANSPLLDEMVTTDETNWSELDSFLRGIEYSNEMDTTFSLLMTPRPSIIPDVDNANDDEGGMTATTNAEGIGGVANVVDDFTGRSSIASNSSVGTTAAANGINTIVHLSSPRPFRSPSSGTVSTESMNSTSTATSNNTSAIVARQSQS